MQSTKSRNVSSSSPNQNKNLKNRGSKTTERASPRSSMPEKKHTGKVSELESQLAQFQEELKKAKDQLSSLEAQKKRAQQEAEDTRKQISSLSAKLEDSQQQLIELSDSEDARLQELRKISQERDRSWQTELGALQKQHAADTAALSSAMNEIQRLKKQLDITAESEATQSRHAESAHMEIQSLRIELAETLELLEKMKHQLADAKESEAQAYAVMSEAQMQLEETKAASEAIRSDSLKVKDAYNSIASELEQSKAQVNTLEKRISQLQADLDSSNAKNSTDCLEKNDHNDEEKNNLKLEIDSLKLEVGKLQSALEASEVRYQHEYIQSTLQIRSAYEAVEHAKLETSLKEAELVEELKKAKEAIEGLKSDLSTKHKILQKFSHENKELSIKIQETNQTNEKESELREELKKLEEDLTNLKSALLDKETQFQTLAEENEMLRNEIGEREADRFKVNEEAVAFVDAAKVVEKVAEQLDTTQMEKAELEAELRRLKVQADQWRKAAEAAAALLSPDCDAKVVEKTVSVDTFGMKMDSPFSDNMDDDLATKKHANMLKKIGGLWKKGQK